MYQTNEMNRADVRSLTNDEIDAVAGGMIVHDLAEGVDLIARGIGYILFIAATPKCN
jgi:hypothetical protein